jgi:hypothetical protein
MKERKSKGMKKETWKVKGKIAEGQSRRKVL